MAINSSSAAFWEARFSGQPRAKQARALQAIPWPKPPIPAKKRLSDQSCAQRISLTNSETRNS
jgi:hypothetical protein